MDKEGVIQEIEEWKKYFLGEGKYYDAFEKKYGIDHTNKREAVILILAAMDTIIHLLED